MRTVECGRRKRGGVNVLRDKVRVNIHHVACRCCKSHNFSFTLPSLSYTAGLDHIHTFTQTHSHFTGNAPKLTLKTNSIIHRISPLLRTTSLTYSSHIWSDAYRHSVYTTAPMHARKHIQCLFLHFTGAYFTL